MNDIYGIIKFFEEKNWIEWGPDNDKAKTNWSKIVQIHLFLPISHFSYQSF